MSELQLADECPDETDEDTAPDSCASKFARKSGRLRIVDDVVVKDIEWLHYDVYCGQRRRPAQYEEHQQPAMHHHCDIQARIIKSCNKLTQGQVAYYTQDPVARPCCLGYLCSSQVSCTNHAIFKPRCHHWRLATTSTNLATGSENKNQDPPTRINFEEKPASYLQS